MAEIVIAGIGRMGKGIALAFAYAGHAVVLVDSEERTDHEFAGLAQSAREELDRELRFLQELSVLSADQANAVMRRIRITSRAQAAQSIGAADFVFEAVVELRDVKRAVYTWLNPYLSDEAIVSSTTSTMAADDLAGFIDGRHRFVNAHWLNPAYLMPLVEVSPAGATSEATVGAMRSLLEGIGKVPVVCKSSPGFIVPRIQALAMNEAARLVEEGVASAEDVDRAVLAGFGIRFATLGLLEFVDWGGGDILYHATRYLEKNLDPQRFGVPKIVRDNMANQRNGLRDGVGFYDWSDRDIDGFRKRKMAEFVELLEHRNLLPRPGMASDQPEEIPIHEREES